MSTSTSLAVPLNILEEQHNNRRGGRELLDRKCQRAASLTQVRLIGDKFLRALSLTSIPPSSWKTHCASCSSPLFKAA